jgi:hypothetical protein
MGDGIDVDFSDLTHLIADLSGAPQKAINNTVGAVEKVSEKVRDDWREPLKASEYLPGGAGTVTHEVTIGGSVLASSISGEVGPILRGQGPLVGMLEYGTPNTGARGYGAEALRKNEQTFIDEIQKAGDVL